MKALLLVGGQGTRLRPLTIHAPKPIVPILDRPFLHYQLDLIRRLPEIDEVILSLNYQPGRIEDVIGDGRDRGVALRYVVEPTPLGTGGAVRFGSRGVTDTIVVLNGDVLTEVDLGAVVDLHRRRRAKATIVLTPVENPTAYGLVETDAAGNVRRFLEKPSPEEITCDTINAGIYVLEPSTFDRIPDNTAWSIERSFFPSLVERGETFAAYVHRGYWIDIGTPEKYLQVHRDIMDGLYAAPPFAGSGNGLIWVAPGAAIDAAARLQGPVFIAQGAAVGAGARVGPYAVIGRDCRIGDEAVVEGSIVWAGTQIGREAAVHGSILGRSCDIGRNARLEHDVMGDRTTIADYSRL